MNVREAIPSDAEAVREAHRRSIEGLGPEAYDLEQVHAWAAGCESADYVGTIEGDGVFLVADRGSDGRPAIIGFGSMIPEPSEGYERTVDGEITGLYVVPSVARRGVGTALYKELERRARADGIDQLGLQASRNAVPFYEAHGYERVREQSHEFSAAEDTGIMGRVVEMTKRLD